MNKESKTTGQLPSELIEREATREAVYYLLIGIAFGCWAIWFLFER